MKLLQEGCTSPQIEPIFKRIEGIYVLSSSVTIIACCVAHLYVQNSYELRAISFQHVPYCNDFSFVIPTKEESADCALRKESKL